MIVHDLTGWIHNGMWRYCPEYPGAAIGACPKPAYCPPEVDVFCQTLSIGGQTGTYIETRAHVDRRAPPVTSLPAGDFILPAAIVDVGLLPAGARITRAMVEGAVSHVRTGDAILIAGGWDRRWREPDFVDGSPHLSAEAAHLLMDFRPRLLGADFPRFDSIRAPEFPWARLWDEVTFVLAPLANLRGLSCKRGTLVALPLKVEDAPTAPTRAVLIEEEKFLTGAPSRG